MLRPFLAILACLWLALPAHAQHDTRLQALQTGDEARGWQAVGRLNMDGVGFCTATLIAPDRVLTAAHCLYDRRSGAQIDVARLQFLAGWRTGRAEAVRGVRRAAVWPEFDFAAGEDLANVPRDLAVLELDQPIRLPQITPFGVSDAVPRPGSAVTVVSYARDRSEAPSIQEACHVLEQRRDGVSVFSCDIGFGSSGSPVLAGIGDNLSVVSVISALARSDARPISLGMRLGARVAALQAALDADVSGLAVRGPRGARDAARFVRP